MSVLHCRCMYIYLLTLNDFIGPNTINVFLLQHSQNTIHVIILCKCADVLSMFLTLKMTVQFLYNTIFNINLTINR